MRDACRSWGVRLEDAGSAIAEARGYALLRAERPTSLLAAVAARTVLRRGLAEALDA